MRLASANHPPRAGRPPVRRYGADVVALQERPDRVGVGPLWGRWRPRRGRSTAMVWRRGRVKVTDRGHELLGTQPNPRYLTWIKADGLLVASVHMPAFKTRNADGYQQQMRHLAAWLNDHPAAVVLGDFNAEPGSRWVQPLKDVGAHVVTAATHGRKHLDHAWSITTPIRLVGTVATRSDHKALIVDAT